MKGSNYNLQFLHHSEVFPTREDALTYLNDYYKPFSLDAEPIMVKYGDVRKPDAIIAFGTSDNAPGSFYAIDMTKANEEIDALNETVTFDSEEIAKISTDLSEVITASGLDVDDNKITNRINYKPDPNDAVIGNATTIAQAIDLISKYAQESSSDMSVEDSDSVKLLYEANANEGTMTLKAIVKISVSGSDDELDFNNNIIGVKSDGLFASAYLDYDDVRHELVFTTSGVKNGHFQDDAIIQRISLGEHTKIIANNEDKTVKITVAQDTQTNTTTLSADVQVSSSADNLIQITDHTLFASNRARDIKFGDSNVGNILIEHKDKFNELDTEIASIVNTEEEQAAAIEELTTEVNKKIESVEVEKNSDLQYFINVDGVKVGEINIPEDQFLENVSYNPATKILTLVFKVSVDGSIVEQRVEINISDLVDVYTAGDGLGVNNNEFFVKKNNESETYLNVTNEGVGIFGIDAALATKADKTETTILSNKIDVINGNESVEGSIKNAIKVSKDYTDSKAYTAGDGLGVNNNEFFVKLNEDSESYLTVSSEGLKLSGVSNALASKANVNDVYTKAEADNKFLTSQSLTNYATLTDLAEVANDLVEVANDLAEVDEKVDTNTTNLSNLTATVNDMKFVTEESDTVVMTMVKETGAETRTLKSEVKLKTVPSVETPNIIKSDANGLYATVSFNYDKAANKITFNDGNGTKEFELNNFGILEDAFYDAQEKEIVLVVKKDDQTTERITIPVGDLVNTWSVENKATSPIVLEKTEGIDGDVLSADLSILNNSNNLLVVQNGSLFADADANAHRALWGADETTVQGALNELKTRTDEIAGIQQDIENLEEDNQNIKTALATYQTDLNAQKDRISRNETNIETLQTVQNEHTSDLNLLKYRVEAIEARIEEVSEQTTTALNLINQTRAALGDIESNPQTVAERLAALEDAMTRLIDFGEYNEPQP